MMGGASSTDSKVVPTRVQSSTRNQVVPIVEATQATQAVEDAARLRQQLRQEKEDHARALEDATVANRKLLDEAALAERLRLDSEAAAERERLDEEAALQRTRLDQEDAAERRRIAEVAAAEAAADRKRLDEAAAMIRAQSDEDAALERRRLDNEAATTRLRLDEEAAAARKQLDVEALTERRRLDDEAAATRLLLDEEATAARKQLDAEALTERRRLDDESAARRKELNDDAAARRARLDDEASAERRRLDDEASAERRRLDDEASAERRRLDGIVMALQQQLQGLLASLSTSGPMGSVHPTSAAAEPVVATRVVALPAPLPVSTGSEITNAAAAASAAAEQERERLAQKELLQAQAERKRQEALEDAAALQRRKAEEEIERNWQDQDLLAGIPSRGTQLEELPSSILDLHDGMPAPLREAPMRLLLIDAVLSWPNIRVYEEVKKGEECVEVPYNDVDPDTWNATLILSWRWSHVKPTEYEPNFAPMSDLQFAELTAVLRRAKSHGIRYAWIDWCCVPQYKSSPMVEVLRSKVFYARARAMFVLPTFVPIPTEGIVKLLLVKAIRIVRSHAESTSSRRCQIALGLLESILNKGLVAGREYFTRVWTLAERMARFGRPERLCNWLSLESWLGMLVDAMLKSTEDRSASEIYKRILGREVGRRLDAILDPLEAAIKTGSIHVSEGLEEQVAELFELAVGIWHTEKELAEAPTKQWLESYLLDAHSGIYQAWSQADRVWAVYSYFCWKQLDQSSDSSLLEALQDLVRVTGGSRRLLMCMATKLGLAKAIAPADVDKKLVTAAENNNTEELMAALQGGAFPDFPGTDGGTALYFAAEKGNLEAVKMLLKCGANVNRKNVIGATALHAASTGGHVEVLTVLLEAGAQVDEIRQGGRTPLHVAAVENHDAAVRVLLKGGANKNAVDDDGKTPLYLAALSNKTPDVVRVLLEADVNKDIKSKNGYAILHAAAQNGNDDIIRLLLQAGLDPNVVQAGEKALTPLHVAAEVGKAAAIHALAKGGAKMDANGSAGTPLHRACVYNHADAVKALCQCKASTESREPSDRRTPLMSAAQQGSVEALKAMIDAGARVEATDKDGWMPIHYAAKEDSYECCKLLKAAGSTTKKATSAGNYPSDLCSSSRVRGILPDGKNLLQVGSSALMKAFF
ncbi:hypothetical protein VaNZ11_007284 [Volvox africanus]|uniref:Heterokaryon incompatibility domain-containing protein n=1 Tax=Volvox africanus TaxID=51714 RepID=A0ABQ5S2X9_9CHLO|nr:hypothetical protein VaNZ11_007284 [Volvox africanus]